MPISQRDVKHLENQISHLGYEIRRIKTTYIAIRRTKKRYRKALFRYALAKKNPRLTKPWDEYASNWNSWGKTKYNKPEAQRCFELFREVEWVLNSLREAEKRLAERASLPEKHKLLAALKEELKTTQFLAAKRPTKKKTTQPVSRWLKVGEDAFVPKWAVKEYLKTLKGEVHTLTQEGRYIISHERGRISLVTRNLDYIPAKEQGAVIDEYNQTMPLQEAA